MFSPDTANIKTIEDSRVESQRTISSDTPEFKAWFGNSKVVSDNRGTPLVVYHGTRANFDTFKPGTKTSLHGSADQMEGIHFTDSVDGASFYSLVDNDDRFLKKVYLSIQNPYHIETIKELKSSLNVDSLGDVSQKVKALGYDGIIVDKGFYSNGGPYKKIVAFYPEQIKSIFAPANIIQSPQQEEITTPYNEEQQIEQQAIVKNWYKKATAKTLYHGTSINNYDSIKSIGLVPDVGDFVTDSYSGEYEAAGVDFDPTPVTFATDKEDLEKAVTAMTYAVTKMLGKGWHDITLNELKNYGMLVIIKQGADYMEQRPHEETGPWGDWQGETDNQYPAVEPGDYYSEDLQDGHILVGNKMVAFLTKQGLWPPTHIKDTIEEIRNQLLTMAIRYHVKKQPELKDQIIEQVKQKVMSLRDEEVNQNYKIYSEKINELV